MANGPIPIPKNINDLKILYNQYGSLLTPENKALVGELINKLEQGASPQELQKMAQHVNQKAVSDQRQFAGKAQQNQQPSPKRRTNQAPRQPNASPSRPQARSQRGQAVSPQGNAKNSRYR